MIQLKLRRKKSQLKEHQQARAKGKKVARKSTQRAEYWEHFIEIKENGKRVVGKCKYCNKIYKAKSTKNGTKN